MTADTVARIRRATMSDADLSAVTSVVNSVTPERGTGPVEMRWSAETYPGGARFLAEAPDGRAVGTASVGRIYVHPPEYDGYWVEISVLPELRRRGVGQALLRAVSEVARAAGKTALHVPASDGRPEGIDFLTKRGFSEFERSKAVRLDLHGHLPPPVAPPTGVRIVTLASRPDLVPALHAVAVEALPDIPGGEPMAAGDLAEFRARDIDRPRMPWDGFFVALDDEGEVLGYASVLVAAARPAVAYHDLTAVRRASRGRGIAGALKRAIIDWAISAGLEALEASNDEVNLPMRAINRRLGYRPLRDGLILRGPVFGGIMGR
jgi:GNAT superfamily N-acetyltransferase